MTASRSDYVILGGGLAGTLLSLHTGMEKSLVVDGEMAERGSSAMVGLCHPFPGRSFTATDEHRKVIETAVRVYRHERSRYPEHFQDVHMLRPLSGPAGKRLVRSWSEQEGPIAGVEVSLRSEKWMTENHPHLRLEGEVLSYTHSFGVEMRAWLRRRAAEQEREGRRLRRPVKGIRRLSTGWALCFEGGEILTASNLVLALGAAGLHLLPEWRGEAEFGHLLRLEENPLSAAVSRGDIHWTPNQAGAVVGSTRWKFGQTGLAEPDAEKVLLQRAESLLGEPVHRKEMWRGARCVAAGDRRPTAGLVPGLRGLSLLTGLGSKGLLWGPYAAATLAQELEGKGRGLLPGAWDKPPCWEEGEERAIPPLRVA